MPRFVRPSPHWLCQHQHAPSPPVLGRLRRPTRSTFGRAAALTIAVTADCDADALVAEIAEEVARFAEANDDLTATSLRAGRLMSLMFPTVTLFISMSSVAVLWLGADRINAGEMELGSVVAYLSYLVQVLIAVAIGIGLGVGSSAWTIGGAALIMLLFLILMITRTEILFICLDTLV